MKRKWKELKMLLGICAAFGWWGILYPEFTLLPDTYRIISEDGEVVSETGKAVSETGETVSGVEARDASYPDAVYYDILRTNTDHLVYKSRLLEGLDRLFAPDRDTDAKEQKAESKAGQKTGSRAGQK